MLVSIYVRSNPDVISDLRNLCNLEVEPKLLVEQGRDLARKGDKEGAITKFKDAQKQGLDLGFKPQAEANRVFEANEKIDKGLAAAKEGKLQEAESIFKEAIALEPALHNSGIDPTREAKRLYALALLDKAQGAISDKKIQQAINDYEKVKQLYPEIQISAKTLDALCRSGSNKQYADKILKYCDDAVKLAPKNGKIRNNRGIVRLFLKKPDLQGAIQDFEALIKWTNTEEALNTYNKDKLEDWKGKLKKWREMRQQCIKYLSSMQKSQVFLVPGKNTKNVQFPNSCVTPLGEKTQTKND